MSLKCHAILHAYSIPEALILLSELYKRPINWFLVQMYTKGQSTKTSFSSQNLLFYYESENTVKPSGVIFLEVRINSHIEMEKKLSTICFIEGLLLRASDDTKQWSRGWRGQGGQWATLMLYTSIWANFPWISGELHDNVQTGKHETVWTESRHGERDQQLDRGHQNGEVKEK